MSAVVTGDEIGDGSEPAVATVVALISAEEALEKALKSRLDDGIPARQESEVHGRVIFSIAELPLNAVFYVGTGTANTVYRPSQAIAVVNDVAYPLRVLKPSDDLPPPENDSVSILGLSGAAIGKSRHTRVTAPVRDDHLLAQAPFTAASVAAGACWIGVCAVPGRGECEYELTFDGVNTATGDATGRHTCFGRSVRVGIVLQSGKMVIRDGTTTCVGVVGASEGRLRVCSGLVYQQGVRRTGTFVLREISWPTILPSGSLLRGVVRVPVAAVPALQAATKRASLSTPDAAPDDRSDPDLADVVVVESPGTPAKADDVSASYRLAVYIDGWEAGPRGADLWGVGRQAMAGVERTVLLHIEGCRVTISQDDLSYRGVLRLDNAKAVGAGVSEDEYSVTCSGTLSLGAMLPRGSFVISRDMDAEVATPPPSQALSALVQQRVTEAALSGGRLVIALDEVVPQGYGRPEVGGKALHLGELIAAKQRVPPGAVLSTRAYERHMQGLVLGIVPGLSTEQLNHRLSEIQTRILDTPVDDSLRTQVQTFLTSLTEEQLACGLAVRSSASEEDGAAASYAGQFESYLNVHGLDDVIEAIKKCWASLWSMRTFVYATNDTRVSIVSASDPLLARKMAVILQVQIESKCSGVLFTINPQAALEPSMVVEAVWGQGELLVSGEVTPARFILDWRTQKETRRVPCRQFSKLIRNGRAGLVRVDTPPAENQNSPLSDAELGELVRAGLSISMRYGCPQDIEWAIDQAGVLHILQTRAITSFECTTPDIGQWYPFLYPALRTLTQSLQGTGHSMFIKRWGISIGHWNENTLPTTGNDTEAGGHDFKRWYFGQFYARFGLLEILQQRGVYDLLLETEAPNVELFKDAYEHARTELLDLARTCSTLETPALGTAATMMMEWYLRATVPAWAVTMMAENLSAKTAEMIAGINEALKEHGLNSRLVLSNLLAGLPSHTGKAAEDLEQLAQAIRDAGHGALVAVALVGVGAGEDMLKALREHPHPAVKQVASDMQAYVEQYFWMSEDDQSLSSDTHWRDHPEIPLSILKSLLHDTVSLTPVDISSLTQIRQQEESNVEIIAKTSVRQALQAKVRALRRYMALKEDLHVVMSELGYCVFLIIKTLGERWAATGLIGTTDDVWNLEYATIIEFIKGKISRDALAVISVRRQKAASMFRNMRFPPWIYNGKKVADDAGRAAAKDESARGEGWFEGTGLASGQAKGIARVISTLEEGHLVRPGDVLVTQRTTPGWTPLFSLVCGLIVEEGGLLSHSAIVARERGIPVVLLPNARNTFKSGETVILNGGSGDIIRPKEQASK